MWRVRKNQEEEIKQEQKALSGNEGVKKVYTSRLDYPVCHCPLHQHGHVRGERGRNQITPSNHELHKPRVLIGYIAQKLQQ